MGFLTRALGLEALSEQPSGDYSADVTPPARSTASPVTVDRALGLPAVYRAIVLIAGMAAQLQLKSYRGTTLVEPAHALTVQPDPWRPLSSWIERAVVGMATDGNAFLRRTRDPLGTSTLALEVLNPFRVQVLRDAKTGAKSYGYTHEHTNRFEKLRADEVIHVWGLEVPGLDRGLGPIAWCRLSLGGALDVRDYAANWFRSGDVPSGVLTTDQRLDREMGRAYKRVWLGLDPETGEPEADRDAGPSVKVLGQGLSYSPIALKPEDAQWIEAQKFGVLDVARIFGLPADYLLAAVDGTSLTYANLEMIDAQFLRTTLFPSYLRKLEAAVTEALPRGQVARFDASELLRPDAKTRAEIDAIHLAHGVVGPQDVRDRERIPGTAPGKPAPTSPAPTTPTEEPAR